MSVKQAFVWMAAPMLLSGLIVVVGCTESIEHGGGAKSKVDVTIIPSGGEGGGGGGAAAVEVAGYGSLKGTVTIEGAIPNLPQLVQPSQVKPDDADVCVAEKIPNQKLVTNGNAVANVFIYLQKAPAGTKMPEAAPAEVTMDHKTCTFVPHAMVVMTGQPIRVVNDDGVAHNVHTKPTRNGEFNTGIGANNRTGAVLSYAIAERLPAKVICDYHAWMSAWHLPLDHPYGAVTGENGEFEIRDLPAGKHKFIVWHEGSTLQEVEVTIEPDQEATLDLAIPSNAFKVAGDGGERSRMVTLSSAR